MSDTPATPEISQVLTYFQNVLGLSQFKIEGSPTEFAEQSAPLTFRISKENASLEIFKKMIAAMQLDGSLFQIDTSDETPQSSLVVVFGEELFQSFGFQKTESGEWVEQGSTKWLWTYAPSQLELDASLKKRAWQDLQKVMRELNH